MSLSWSLRPGRVQRKGAGGPTARSFSHLESLPSEPEWLWRGFVAPGSLTLVAGPPFAGKSLLVGGLLKAMAAGESFAGLETRPASALLLTEEDGLTLRDRASLLGLLEVEGEYVGPSEGVLALPWPRLISWARRKALDSGHELLIVDTFPGLAGLREEQENDAGAITERLRPLREAAADGLAVLCLHHTNAQGRARGSSAFRGVADISVTLSRSEGTRIVTLKTQSRFWATPGTLGAKLGEGPDGLTYEPIEMAMTASSVVRVDTDALLWEALDKAGPEGISYEEIHALPGLSRDKAKKRFPSWLEQKKIDHHGDGKKGDQLRWFIPDPAIRCGASPSV